MLDVGFFVLMFFIVCGIVWCIRSLFSQSGRQSAIEDELDDLILSKQSHLNKLDSSIKETKSKLESIQIDHDTHLTKLQNDVIDLYEHQGIRIPVDILDELQFNSGFNEKELISYIECQRQQWKMECSKKLYRG